MRRIVIPRRWVEGTFGAAVVAVVFLLVLNTVHQGRALDAVSRENRRAIAAETEIVQTTVDRMALVARLERQTACEADERVRRAAAALIRQSGIPLPTVFRPRDCVRLADEYAERLRSAGPLRP